MNGFSRWSIYKNIWIQNFQRYVAQKVHYKVIQSSALPSKGFYEKLTNAFSNITYSIIIWRFLYNLDQFKSPFCGICENLYFVPFFALKTPYKRSKIADIKKYEISHNKYFKTSLITIKHWKKLIRILSYSLYRSYGIKF